MTEGGSTGGSDRGSAPRSAAHLNALPIGTRVAEFEIREVLGEGGFGIVYRAFDHSLGVDAALKEYLPSALAYRQDAQTILPRSMQHRPTFDAGLASFLQEARVIAQFDHPALVRVRRVWEANGTAYMAMAFYAGTTLREAVRRDPAFASQARLESLLRPLLDGVGRLHARRFYHRDIAPDNILVQPGGEPVLIDFGAARTVIGGRTQALTAVLKPGYAPIEQYADDAQLAQGPWTDVYGFAATLCFAITGKPPPTAAARALADAMVPLAAQAPAGYEPRFLAGIDRGLAVRPQDRPQTLPEFAAALGLDPSVAEHTIVLSRPASATEAIVPAPPAVAAPAVPAAATAQALPRRRRSEAPRMPRFAGRVAALALVAIGGAATYYWLAPAEVAPPPAAVPAAGTAGAALPPASGAAEAPEPPPRRAEPALAAAGGGTGDAARDAARGQAPAVAPRGQAAVAGGQRSAPPPTVPAAVAPESSPPVPAASATAAPAVPPPPLVAPPDAATGMSPAPADPRGQYELGRNYEAGRGVAKDAVAAVRWFRRAAEAGYRPAMIALAAALEAGRGTPASIGEAIRWYGKAADLGEVTAQFNLGVIYGSGRGVARDLTAAAGWYRKAADQGYAPAQHNLGRMYENGWGVARDDAAATRLYELAAAQGHAGAEHQLGVTYATGRGKVRNDVLAASWYRKAADHGYAPAQASLGEFYEAGRGVFRNADEAFRLYSLAAAQGYAGGQYLLAHAFEAGIGAARDPARALFWYRKAAAAGHAEAAARIRRLEAAG